MSLSGESQSFPYRHPQVWGIFSWSQPMLLCSNFFPSFCECSVLENVIVASSKATGLLIFSGAPVRVRARHNQWSFWSASVRVFWVGGGIFCLCAAGKHLVCLYALLQSYFCFRKSCVVLFLSSIAGPFVFAGGFLSGRFLQESRVSSPH